MKTTAIVSLCLVLGLASVAMAVPKSGTFWAVVEGSASDWNVLITSESGGSGAMHSGPWYPYPSTTPQQDLWGNFNPTPSWHNQWYWNDPYDPDRWKIVTLDFTIALDHPDMGNGGGIITINWTTPNWTNPDDFPATNEDPANHEIVYVGRQDIYNLWLPLGDHTIYTFHQEFDLRDYGIDYNPEWISIDIAGYNFKLSSPDVPGSIIHECVPEPVTLSLLALGGLGLLRRKRD